jgi:hypothetical protein
MASRAPTERPIKDGPQDACDPEWPVLPITNAAVLISVSVNKIGRFLIILMDKSKELIVRVLSPYTQMRSAHLCCSQDKYAERLCLHVVNVGNEPD